MAGTPNQAGTDVIRTGTGGVWRGGADDVKRSLSPMFQKMTNPFYVEPDARMDAFALRNAPQPFVMPVQMPNQPIGPVTAYTNYSQPSYIVPAYAPYDPFGFVLDNGNSYDPLAVLMNTAGLLGGK